MAAIYLDNDTIGVVDRALATTPPPSAPPDSTPRVFGGPDPGDDYFGAPAPQRAAYPAFAPNREEDVQAPQPAFADLVADYRNRAQYPAFSGNGSGDDALPPTPAGGYPSYQPLPPSPESDPYGYNLTTQSPSAYAAGLAGIAFDPWGAAGAPDPGAGPFHVGQLLSPFTLGIPGAAMEPAGAAALGFGLGAQQVADRALPEDTNPLLRFGIDSVAALGGGLAGHAWAQQGFPMGGSIRDVSQDAEMLDRTNKIRAAKGLPPLDTLRTPTVEAPPIPTREQQIAELSKAFAPETPAWAQEPPPADPNSQGAQLGNALIAKARENGYSPLASAPVEAGVRAQSVGLGDVPNITGDSTPQIAQPSLLEQAQAASQRGVDMVRSASPEVGEGAPVAAAALPDNPLSFTPEEIAAHGVVPDGVPPGSPGAPPPEGPTPTEIAGASDVPPRRTLSSVVLDAMNVPRTLLTSFSLHGPLRQGVWLGPAHPQSFVQALVDGVKAIAGHAEEVQQALDEAPYAQLRKDSGVYQAPLAGQHAELSAGEEAFMSQVLDKVPGITQSKNWYVTFLNSLRAHVFDGIAGRWEGDASKTPQDYEQLANMVNVFSGRGNIPDIGQLSPLLNASFFSPRQTAAMFQRPYMLVDPSISSAVRLEAARNIGATVATGVGILALMKARGITVGTDPRATDFGKYVIGQQHGDFWGGESQTARLVAQLLTGQTVTGSGSVKSEDRAVALANYLKNRLSPGATLALGALDAATSPNDTLFAIRHPDLRSIGEGALNNFGAIDIHDIIDGIRTGGLKGGLIALPSIGGSGVTNYGVPGETDKYYAADAATRAAMLEANPGLQAQLSEQAQQQGGLSASLDEVNTTRLTQEAAAAKLFDPQNPKSFRDMLSNINLQTQAKQEQADRDYQAVAQGAKPMPTDPSKAALYQYYQALDANRLPGGKLDGEAFDTRLAELQKAWTPDQQAYVTEQTGIDKPHGSPLVDAYYRDAKTIRDSGYFDARKQAYDLVTKQAGLPSATSTTGLVKALTPTYGAEAAPIVAAKVDAAVAKMMESWRLAPSHKAVAQLIYKWGYGGGAKEKIAAGATP